MTITISSQFDGGNIECVKCDCAKDIHLNIVPDTGDEFFQWFFFRLTAKRDIDYVLTIDNAGKSSYPDGWKDYRVVASYDRQDWFRIDTQYENGVLQFSLNAQSDTVWFAYFTPYTMQQHDDLIAQCAIDTKASIEVLGTTIDGRDIDLISVGSMDKPIKIWSIARQHPGESMAQWWMDGYLQRLLDDNDVVARELLAVADFYIVPNMNPDGSFRGHLRTNAAGVNLNREWDKTTVENSPEVYHVLNRMRETGVSLNLDVHGDEALPYNFIAGTEGIKSWNRERLALQELFKENLMRINPAFQSTVGYPVSSANTANYGICSSFIAETFNCPAMTLEMPFKDNALQPDLQYGWSAQSSSMLGRSCLEAIHSIVDHPMIAN